jgi:hypothetical protein
MTDELTVLFGPMVTAVVLPNGLVIMPGPRTRSHTGAVPPQSVAGAAVAVRLGGVAGQVWAWQGAGSCIKHTSSIEKKA